MASYNRLLAIAAATGIATMVWIAAPAGAAESIVTDSYAEAVTPADAPAIIKRRVSRAARIAAVQYDRRDRRVSASHLDCSGVWCGRQFVLMLGIGY